MPKDQTWRPLDAKQNELDCILWISHSQGNGTTPPGNILGIQADAFGFLDFWGLLLVFSHLGTQMPAALPCAEWSWARQSCPTSCRTFKCPAGNAGAQDYGYQNPVSQANANYSMPVLKKTPSFLLSCKSRENVFFNALPRIVCLVLKIMGPSRWPGGWDCSSSVSGMVQSLIRKLRSHMPHSTAKNKN